MKTPYALAIGLILGLALGFAAGKHTFQRYMFVTSSQGPLYRCDTVTGRAELAYDTDNIRKVSLKWHPVQEP